MNIPWDTRVLCTYVAQVQLMPLLNTVMQKITEVREILTEIKAG